MGVLVFRVETTTPRGLLDNEWFCRIDDDSLTGRVSLRRALTALTAFRVGHDEYIILSWPFSLGHLAVGDESVNQRDY